MTQPAASPASYAYECNGASIAREAFYAIACDPRRSVAVEACAGAGKTWMLVSRILRALLDGCAPHEILAITFTKKAAGEMRQRLQEWLQDFARQTPQRLEAELIARGIPPKAARDKREQLQNLYRQTLDAGRPLQIRTFHSWFAALLSSAPLSVLEQHGLPTRYELLEDDEAAMAEVWRPFLHTVAHDAALRADYEACIAAHGRHQTHKALEAALKKRVEFTLADQAGVAEASMPAFGVAFPALAGLSAPCQALHGEAASTRWHARARALGAEKNKTPQKAAQGVVEAFLLDDLEQRLAKLRKAFLVANADRLTAHLQSYPLAQEAEAELQQLCAAQRQHAAWLHQQRMIRLTRCLIAEFAALKRARGWIDMNDIERTALALLSDPVLSGWVQERLDARVRHLLIDEFQDTNPLQWQALHAWLSGYAGAGGGQHAPSVFIVGDPKQSIYRFRRAEPQVFRAAQAFVQDALGGDLLACDHTRRNASGVIGCVNRAMQQAQDAGDYGGFRPHTTESQQAGTLLHLPPIERMERAARGRRADGSDGGDSSDDSTDSAAARWRDSLAEPRHEAEETLLMRECAQAAQWVAAQIAAGLAPQDILVLARKHERLAQMQQALRALHIPCVRPDKSQLTDAPEVQDVLALLDALVSPGHDLALARALKSPLFGASDEQLIRIELQRRQWQAQQDAAVQAEPQEAAHTSRQSATSVPVSWFDVLQKSELSALDLKGFGADLTLYQQWVQALPPHDALQAIYVHRDALARYAAATPATQRASVLAHLRALLAAALDEAGGRYLTPYAFVRAMRSGGPRAPGRVDDQAVRLLTVHGAKGLEAQTVLLLDTDAAGQRAETMGVLVDWPGEAAVPRHFVFLASETSPPPSVRAVLEREVAARRREELNTLYVAVTRAKTCLVLSCVQARTDAPGSWWQRLLPDLQPAGLPGEGGAGSPAEAAAITLHVLPEYIAQPQTRAAPPPASTLQSRQGEAMHQLLEQLADPAALDSSPARLVRLVRDFDIPLEAAERAAAMARAIVQGEGAWAWDAGCIEHAMNEVPLTWQGQGLRLDRLVRLRVPRQGARWWVLDYKSAAEPEQQAQLLAQLHRYRQALSALLPGEAVQAAFLTGDGRLVTLDGARQVELF